MFANVPMCERCWFRLHDYAPLRLVRVSHPERCHTCGWPSVAGIFVQTRTGGPPTPDRQLVLEPGDVVYTLAEGVARQWGVTEGGQLVDEGRQVRDVVGEL